MVVLPGVAGGATAVGGACVHDNVVVNSDCRRLIRSQLTALSKEHKQNVVNGPT